MFSTFADREVALPDTVVVGRVLRAHGLRGEVRVEVLSDVAERFAPGSELLLLRPGRKTGERVRVETFRPLPDDGALLRFEGCDDRARAEAIRGAALEVAREQVPPAPEKTYYYFELVGCACHDAEAGDLGTVVDIVEDGGGHLLQVDDQGRTLLIPFVAAYIEALDVTGRRIDLRLPPGLVETCASES